MQEILQQLGIKESNGGAATGKSWIESKGKTITSYSPVDGKRIADVIAADEAAYEQVMQKASAAFLERTGWVRRCGRLRRTTAAANARRCWRGRHARG